MSTTYAQLEAQAACPSSRLLAMTLFIEALRSEGLRLANPEDVQRMAKLAKDAANLFLSEDPGPLTGPTSRQPSATNRHASEADVGVNGQPEDLENGSETELGSIEVCPCPFCGSPDHQIIGHREVEEPVGLISLSYVECQCCRATGPASRSQASDTNHDECNRAWNEWTVRTPVKADEMETGSIDPKAHRRQDPDSTFGPLSAVALERLWDREGHLAGSTTRALFATIDERENQRAAAVRRADAIAAERDREASKVAYQTTQVNDLEIERDAATCQAEAMEAERDRLARRDALLTRDLRASELRGKGLKCMLEEWGQAADAIGLPPHEDPAERLRAVAEKMEVESLPVVTRRRVTKDAAVGDRVRHKKQRRNARIVKVHDCVLEVRLAGSEHPTVVQYDEVEYIGDDAGPEHVGEQATMVAGSIASEVGQ
jgi:hypothetical protein